MDVTDVGYYADLAVKLAAHVKSTATMDPETVRKTVMQTPLAGRKPLFERLRKLKAKFGATQQKEKTTERESPVVPTLDGSTGGHGIRGIGGQGASSDTSGRKPQKRQRKITVNQTVSKAVKEAAASQGTTGNAEPMEKVSPTFYADKAFGLKALGPEKFRKAIYDAIMAAPVWARATMFDRLVTLNSKWCANLTTTLSSAMS